MDDDMMDLVLLVIFSLIAAAAFAALVFVDVRFG